MSHTGVGGAAAAEGPLVGPAAGGTLDGQQDVAASTGRFQVSLFAGHLVGVEHDPEGPVVAPVLDSNDVLAEHSKKVTRLQAELNHWLSSVVNSINGKDYADE